MLEDHALEFLESWVNAFGLYVEQGVESLHATINRLNVNFRFNATKKKKNGSNAQRALHVCQSRE